ncbi:MAG: NOL1/NOP2/sun family putative RNA methylase [Cyanobacteria bacterium P01_A01_bin.37]
MNDHLLKRYSSLVDEPDKLWSASHLPLPTCIWSNGLKTSEHVLLHELSRRDIHLDSVAWCHGAFRSQAWAKPGEPVPYLMGWYLIQEEIAMTAVHALAPDPGDRVLDLCAAPGNKTVQIASRLSPGGIVVANEWNTGRLSSLWNAIARMGVMNVATMNADGRTLPLPNHTFDRVLVDVPCSGEGTLRKHPRRDWSVGNTMKAIARLVPIQKRLLHRALDLVKPGGVVVYSTCTFSPEENEAVLDAVLGDRAVVEPFHIQGLRHYPGLTFWDGQHLRADVVHAHRYYPHLNDTGGFFVARLRRTDAPAQGGTNFGQEHLTPNRAECAHLSWSGYTQTTDELALFGQRFGIASSVVHAMQLWTKGRDKRWLTEHLDDQLGMALQSTDIQNLGLPLFRTVQGRLKPTTAALQRLGTAITRNVIELETPEQMALFLEGTTQPLVPSIGHDLEDGYVHVRSRPYELGCGLWIGGRLHSQLPKALRVKPLGAKQLSR